MSKHLLTEEVKQWYLSNFGAFENSLNGSRNQSFHAVRTQALSRFADLGFPTQREENWKYTNLAAILQQKFRQDPGRGKDVAIDTARFTFDGLRDNLVVFINGKYKPELSSIRIGDGQVILEPIETSFLKHADLVQQHLGQYARFESESFTALNTAFTDDGTFLYLPDDTELSEPLHILHLTDASAEPLVSYPRSLFVVGKNSSVDIVESYHGVGDGVYFNNAVVEIVLRENACVEHTKIQEESTRSFHISNTQVHQESNSRFTAVNIDLGCRIVRNNMNVMLSQPQCETHLFGFYMGNGEQHIDNQTFIDHAMPDCFSNELYKGILDDQARGVFNGKILVRPDAQKTNALQSNKTLLLTDEASVNAKPQLEIFADDVKCTHGATIGQLDDEALFYLRARGIGVEMAGAMLRHAFVSDVLENIQNEAIRDRLDQAIISRFTI